LIESSPAQIAIRGANDEFSNRIALSGPNVSWDIDLAGATRSRGDPRVARLLDDEFDGVTLWWTWTAPATGTATLNCDNWTIAFGVYTGMAAGSLRPVTGPFLSNAQFSVVAGHTYQIMVSDRYPPWAPSKGRVSLTLE
jgi:hypothetical protein